MSQDVGTTPQPMLSSDNDHGSILHDSFTVPTSVSQELAAVVEYKATTSTNRSTDDITTGLSREQPGFSNTPSTVDDAEDINAPLLPESTCENETSSHSHYQSRPTVPVNPASASNLSFSSTSPGHAPATQDATQSLESRSNRRRSTYDSRSTNRISGFFSNLIHRRPDREQSLVASATQETLREEPEHSPVPRGSESSSPPRPPTPPPALPPPSIQDLGLSLTAISATLTPNHFSTPPTSGAFLSPHYLLLCHSQGLDVFPLVSPPAPQPYALIRRVGFKTVVVMEERGVLVAIAGRRDGVRVYALEEVRKAVEWRIDLEIKREKERMRREEAKKVGSGGVDKVFGDLHSSQSEVIIKAKLIAPELTSEDNPKKKRRESIGHSSAPSARSPTTRRLRKTSIDGQGSESNSDPPPYATTPPRPLLRTQPSAISVNQGRSRSGSVTNVLAGGTTRRLSTMAQTREGAADEKGDWEHASSDDEAINMATAGSSGSAALDERTSSIGASGPRVSSAFVTGSSSGAQGSSLDINGMSDILQRTQHSGSSSTRRSRPTTLDVAQASGSNGAIGAPPPSPTPTVWTLRQALASSPAQEGNGRPDASDVDNDDEEEEGGSGQEGPITFAQALLDSRLPGLPPPGTRRPQQAILLGSQSTGATASSTTVEPSNPLSVTQTANSTSTVRSQRSGRRRWSVLDGVFSNSNTTGQMQSAMRSSSSVAPIQEAPTELPSLIRSSSADVVAAASPASSPNPRRLTRNRQSLSRASSMAQSHGVPETVVTPPSPAPSSVITTTTSQNRFISRFFGSAFHSRRSDDHSSTPHTSEMTKRQSGNQPASTPAPKLEYVKLPGTKGAVLIKAVETAKKSFLAILCGDAGEKVELFAGTYRTTLGLSRTFILPDSPRSLELQLQGDDLVEVFLVFSQNVFGLEPATVRVREVRVGRAERRAARRRARELRAEGADTDTQAPAEDEANNSMSNAVTPSASQALDSTTGPSELSNQVTATSVSLATQSDELTALATAQMAPYTTFQQLSFAPHFPLASIADECLIPPTYQSFLQYRTQHEPDISGQTDTDLANVQFTPPGLPIPPVVPPSFWFYRDPKGVIQGPWKASLMQTWYKDGLLPLDLPVRREEDTEYILLRDLRAQSVDPSHPFRPPPPPLHSTAITLIPDPVKPLLAPISLLTQPRHYGPPALFFTSRGGHSTTIVDARGRSVLKGRFMWSTDEDDNDLNPVSSKLGDVRRLEAFDVGDEAVVVAIRQGGLEATNIGDALLRPGDMSRTNFPNFNPPPASSNRRVPFVWKAGSAVSAFASGPISSSQGIMQAPVKKSSSGFVKAANKLELAVVSEGDYETRTQDELLFLGRRDDDVYLCERNTTSFRILHLCPHTSVSRG